MRIRMVIAMVGEEEGLAIMAKMAIMVITQR